MTMSQESMALFVRRQGSSDLRERDGQNSPATNARHDYLSFEGVTIF
jgi:hypothetical protein